MSQLANQTDARGRAGAYRPGKPPAPASSLPEPGWVTEERADGLHIVDAATGHSFGIASSPAIAAAQVAAMNRLSQ